jgi:16S rRNA (cytosine967-C5)-methyltransferase
MSGGTPKGKSSAARGRRMAEKSRPRREAQPQIVTDDPHADIGVEARLVAGVLLNAALEKRTGLDEALAQSPAKDLDGPDRAFARATAMAALRRLGEIDQILDRRLQKAPPAPVRTIMRIALAQTLVLGTPAFAAVSTS